jgi:hypothetical protein
MRGSFTASIVPMALAALFALAVPAHADFSAATLLSGTQQLQFDEANAPAFSADGRYVAFQGSLGEVPGIYRRDLATGQVELVAGGDASAPSISATGRYIAFTSTAVLVPAAKPGEGCPQVYVRDMEPGAGAPEYELASALNDFDVGLSYLPHCSAAPSGELPLGGAQAAPGVALSQDGRHVVFTVSSSSNLVRGAGCIPPARLTECAPETPPSQVAVRDLANETTTLVSATPAGGPTPGGGAFPSSESEQLMLTYGERPSATSDQPTASSAAISADGSTVAWQGTNVPEQVPSATDVVPGMASITATPGEPAADEVEPLWRRVANGAGAVTLRLLAGAGLNLYAHTYQEGAEPIMGGAVGPGYGFAPPALSADGSVVATISNALTPANEATYYGKYISGFYIPPNDAYVVDVKEDPSTAPQAHVTPLTATASFLAPRVFESGVSDVAVSRDGLHVAFDTPRTGFTLAPPESISPPAPEGDYTYEVNVPLGTLQRVTSTHDGAAPDGQAGLLSFSGDDRSLAFASHASNLFFGDAITEAPEVYLVHELPTSDTPAEQSIAPPPAISAPLAAWILNATAVPQENGSLLVSAQAPGAGRLTVKAIAQLPTASAPARRSTAATAHRVAQASGGGVALTAHTVAQASASAKGPSSIQFRLTVSSPYRARLSSHGGLYCIVRVTFTASGRTPLVREIPVTLRILAYASGRKPAARVKRARKPPVKRAK